MGGTINRGLPKLNLPFKRLLNGGYACEFYRFAKVGDTVSRQSRYLEISEREGSSGPMIITKTETVYTNQAGERLLRIVHTEIAR
jgi:hydroxyacyl-ACP dehydratase HTD2-like protein with hotdog domain